MRESEEDGIRESDAVTGNGGVVKSMGSHMISISDNFSSTLRFEQCIGRA